MMKNGIKLVQRRLYSYVNTWSGFTVLLILTYALVSVIIQSLSNPCSLHGLHNKCSLRHELDNIGLRNIDDELMHGPIDVVYTWVNGSDPRWKAKKELWTKLNSDSKPSATDSLALNRTFISVNGTIHQEWNITMLNSNNSSSISNGSSNSTGSEDSEQVTNDPDDTMSQNRYRDSEELRFSLRSLVKNAPWIRHIYLVTDNQIPYWLNLESSKLSVVSHEEIFANTSHLPVFSSPAIEANLHRIPGLSKKFIYFNDDVFLGMKVLPEDFISLRGAQRLVMAWDVPKCAPGCSDSWIGDGFCDKACNVSACNFDFPDCINGTNSNTQSNYGGYTRPSSSLAMCMKGCPDNWLGDKICDQRCKSEECGWDVGDCGIDLVTNSFPGVAINPSNARIFDTPVGGEGMDPFSYGEGADFYGVPDYFFSAGEGDGDGEGEGLLDELVGEAAISAADIAGTGNSTSGNTTDPSLVELPQGRVERAVTSSPTPPPPTLTVEYGTKAAYFDLAYLACMTSTNETCVPEQVTGLLYESAEHDDNTPEIVHTASILSRHHMLLVLLYYGQEGAPEPSWIFYDVKFTVRAVSTTGTSSTAVFTLRMVPPAPLSAHYPGKLVPAGMQLVSKAMVHSCNPEDELVATDLSNSTANATVVTSPTTSVRRPTTFRPMNVLVHPYRDLHTHEEGIVLDGTWNIDLSSHSDIERVGKMGVRYTVTNATGFAQFSYLPLMDALMMFENSPTPSFIPLSAVRNNSMLPEASLHSVLEIAHTSHVVFDAYVESCGPPSSPRFHTPLSLESLLSEGPSHHSTTETATHVRIEEKVFKSFVKVPMPMIWSQLTAPTWLHVHAEVISSSKFPSTEQIVHTSHNQLRWHTASASAAGQIEHVSTVSCISAAVPWGSTFTLSNAVNITSPNDSIAAEAFEESANVTTQPSALESVLHTAHSRHMPLIHNMSKISSDLNTTERSLPSSEHRRDVDTLLHNTTQSSELHSDSEVSTPSRHRHRRLTRTPERVFSYLGDVYTLATSWIWSQIYSSHSPAVAANDHHAHDAARRRRLEDTYGQSLVHVNRIYNKEFGAEGRKVPAHVPHMIDRDYISEMQERWGAQWNDTSSHRFRSPTDMQYSFSYYYYVINRHKVHPHDLNKYLSMTLDTDKDGVLNDNEFRSLVTMVKSSASPSDVDLLRVRECVSNSSTYNPVHTEEALHTVARGKVRKSFTLELHPNIAEVLNCTEVMDGLKRYINWNNIFPSHVIESDKDLVAFEMIGDNYTISLSQLDSVRARQSKFVCINDNMKNPTPELERALRSFYLSFFPEPCIFELPPGTRNPTLYLDEYRAMMKIHGTLHFQIFDCVTGLPVRMLNWSYMKVKNVLRSVAQSTIDMMSDDDTDGGGYISGLRQEISRKPHHRTIETTSTQKAMGHGRLALYLSVLGIIGFVVMRQLSKRR